LKEKTILVIVLLGALMALMIFQLDPKQTASPAAAQDDPTATPLPDDGGDDGEATPEDNDSLLSNEDGFPEVPGGDYFGRVPTGGTIRAYLIHIPPHYDPEVLTPLVVSFHGFTSNPDEHAQRTHLSEKSDEEGFIVVYPAGQRDPMGWYTQPGAEEAGWWNDVTFSRDLIVRLQEGFNVDPRRIFVTGFSNGGGMVHRVACDLSDIVAAAAPVSGPQFRGDPCILVRGMPIFAIHGRLDRNALYDGYYDVLLPIPEWIQDWAELDGCEDEPTVTTPDENITVQTWSECDDDAEVILRTYERGAHVWPQGAEDMIWEFFEAHPMPSDEDDVAE
jgi:polyhydroxybutyrate depolymerase